MRIYSDDENPVDEIVSVSPLRQEAPHRNLAAGGGAMAPRGAGGGIEHGDTGRREGEREEIILPVPGDILDRLGLDAEAVGGDWVEPEAYSGSVGRTMFDTSASEDNTVTVLLPREQINALATQSLVRINSLPDERVYLGVVTRGPFAEPDGLRGDSPIVVTTTVKGGIFMPKFHGRVQVELLGEQTEVGLAPPRYRPMPNSPVFPLSSIETGSVLRTKGEIPLGLAVGHEDLVVCLPARNKSVLPRHTGVLGTTGGGKSTTVSGLVSSFQQAGIATILIDTEGEYTEINLPTEDVRMQRLLERRKLTPRGVENTAIYHLVGRETTNPRHPQKTPFCLQFCNLSPFLVVEILEMTDAQQQRYLAAYDIAKRVLRELKIYPSNEEEMSALVDLDEMEEGYPRMRLEHVYEMVMACAHLVNKKEDLIQFYLPEFRDNKEKVISAIKQDGNLPSHWTSWLALQGRLGRLKRLGIFDNRSARPLDLEKMTTPGRVSIIDLSDTDSPQIRNLVIAELLRGLHIQQNRNYEAAERAKREPVRTMVIIEEAHEFLSAERIQQMPVLFQQVARVARRGRKRWLGLVFVTQLPQHLPDEVLGLINNFILHKIADAGVITRLKRSIGGIDESLWSRLPGLAPGQALVSAASMTRPLLAAIDPSPCKLRMVD